MTSAFDLDGVTGGSVTPEDLIDAAIGDNAVFRAAVNHDKGKEVLNQIAMLTGNIRQVEAGVKIRTYGEKKP
jgi:hypothetical protein